MSGIITPSGLVNELTVITDPDTLSEVNVPGETVNRKIKKSVDKTYFQGTLPGRVTVNEADITSLEGLRDGTEQLNPRSFTSGRFDSQELVSGTLSVSGWYTIAETEAIVAASGNIEIKIIEPIGDSWKIKAVVRGSSSVRNHENTTIKILDKGEASSPSIRFLSVRLVKSDTNASTGFKIQINTTATKLYTQINNFAKASEKGFFLVTPYLDNTPTLPDGVTVGTFLEAGEELSLGNETSGILGVRKISNDICQISVILPEIPKQGTGITISLPSTSLLFHDGSGTSVTITGAHSTSNFTITRQIITFRITEVAKFTTLNSGPLQATWNGSGGKLTIT